MNVKTMTRMALLSAILYVSKLMFEFLPNVELVTLLIILYTLVYGKETFFIILVFNLFEAIQWGFGLWWLSYMYTWPFLCLIIILLRKFIKEEFMIWAVVAGMFGLLFGSFFALVYLPVDPAYALTYWLSGLPWDVWHAVWNFALMAILGRPLYRLLKKLRF